ncbi:PHD finger protein ALFIN-LIKE 3 [Capsicum chinense]|nr:PHD finger protein ALFIN-LIKE 3 [Capsicum chinense]
MNMSKELSHESDINGPRLSERQPTVTVSSSPCSASDASTGSTGGSELLDGVGCLSLSLGPLMPLVCESSSLILMLFREKSMRPGFVSSQQIDAIYELLRDGSLRASTSTMFDTLSMPLHSEPATSVAPVVASTTIEDYHPHSTTTPLPWDTSNIYSSSTIATDPTIVPTKDLYETMDVMKRKRLFSMINELPTTFEIVAERKHVKEKLAADSGSKSRGSTKFIGRVGLRWLTYLFNDIFKTARMPEAWRWSTMIPLYKNKGDIQSCTNYRGIKLLSHTMKIWERLVELRLRRIVPISKNQFGFMPGRSTT